MARYGMQEVRGSHPIAPLRGISPGRTFRNGVLPLSRPRGCSEGANRFSQVIALSSAEVTACVSRNSFLAAGAARLRVDAVQGTRGCRIRRGSGPQVTAGSQTGGLVS
jgi:hypothetical protein